MLGIKLIEPFQNYKSMFNDIDDFIRKPKSKIDWSLRQDKFDFFKKLMDISFDRNFEEQHFFPVFLYPRTSDKKRQANEVSVFVKANKELFLSKKLVLLMVDITEAMDSACANVIENLAVDLNDICTVYLIDGDRKKTSRTYIHHYAMHWIHHKLHENLYNILDLSWNYKTFIFMNKMARCHRVQMLNEILENNLRKHGYISFTKETSCCTEWPSRYPAVLNANFDILDFNNVLEKNPTQYAPFEYCNKSFLFLNTETYCGDDRMFLTEKTFKPMRLGMPFMTIANVGTLDYLKELGFRTFGNWFDESYDTELDLDKRIAIIMNELKRLSTLGHDKIFSMRDEMKPILEHNKRLVEEKTYGKAEIEDVLVKIYEKERIK